MFLVVRLLIKYSNSLQHQRKIWLIAPSRDSLLTHFVTPGTNSLPTVPRENPVSKKFCASTCLYIPSPVPDANSTGEIPGGGTMMIVSAGVLSSAATVECEVFP